jgi:hypothetical protein
MIVCRQRGGESCAFDGAMIVLGCIADAAHLVHGPIACLGNSWESRGTVTTKGELHRRAYTTDLSELDIVYGPAGNCGGDPRNRATPPRAILSATCVTGMIGDIHAACRRPRPTRVPASCGCAGSGRKPGTPARAARSGIGTAEPETPAGGEPVGEQHRNQDRSSRCSNAPDSLYTPAPPAPSEEIRGAHRAHSTSSSAAGR